MFRLDGATKVYAGKPALGPVTLDVPAGRTTVLIGPSGCGKSTLLRLLIGLVEPDAGSVTFDDTPVTAATARAVRCAPGTSFRTAGCSRTSPPAATSPSWPGTSAGTAPRIDARVDELAELTRFPADGLDRYPQQLSGGQRQRVGLMRALMLDPAALLLDEPLGALDPLVRADLQAELRDIFRSLGKTVVLVTHDLGEAAFFADRIVLLRDGQIVQDGQPGRPVAPPGRPVRHPVRAGPARPGGAIVSTRVTVLLLPLYLLAAVAVVLVPGCSKPAAKPVVVGSKKFTESIILAEMGARLARQAGAEARRDDLGGTPALWLALTQGDIDAYLEYTGTITREILKGEPAGPRRGARGARRPDEQAARVPQQLRPRHAEGRGRGEGHHENLGPSQPPRTAVRVHSTSSSTARTAGPASSGTTGCRRPTCGDEPHARVPGARSRRRST